MKKIIFATKNKGKLREVKDILNNSSLQLLSLQDFNDLPEIVESGNSFEENALIKAKSVFERTELPVIADDSGLMVDQLNGRPGIFSARFAGENSTDLENNKKLLEELYMHPEPHIAKFVCCAVYYDGKNIITASGELHGRILKELHGVNGFGYDPLFLPDGFNKTTAELSLKEKNKISHRSKAFRQLKEILL